MSQLSVQQVTLLSLIRQWAAARNLINGSDSRAQSLKYMSEFGELGGAIVAGATSQTLTEARKAQDQIADGIGDAVVVLTIIAAQEGFLLEEAVHGTQAHIVDGYAFYSAASTFGLLADAILKGNKAVISDLAGKTYQHLADLADHLGLEFVDCLKAAYEEIKDRKGVMYEGSFIKSTDALYPEICEKLGKEQ